MRAEAIEQGTENGSSGSRRVGRRQNGGSVRQRSFELTDRFLHTRVSLIYRRTNNLCVLESTVRYLGIEVEDVLEISEQIELYRFKRFGRLAAPPVVNRKKAAK